MTAVDLASLRLPFAFTAGVFTFLAPCAYPLLPGYVAFYLGRDGGEEAAAPDPVGRRLLRAGGVGLLVSFGFFLVYAALVGVVIAVGARALSSISVLELVVGVLLVGLGVAMATGRASPSALHVALPERRRSATGFVLFGVVYAAAAAGCTAPLFVAVALNALGNGPVAAVATFGAYAAGMSVLMVGVTVASALGRDALLRRLSKSTGRVTRVAGVLLVGAGLVQVYFFLFEFGGLEMLGLA